MPVDRRGASLHSGENHRLRQAFLPGDFRLQRCIEVLHSYQANADLLLFFWAPSDHSRIGVSGGYRYNNVLGHGAAWGLEVEADVSQRMTLFLSLSTARRTRALRDSQRAGNRHFCAVRSDRKVLCLGVHSGL